MKKIIILAIIATLSIPVSGKEYSVEVTPGEKITTCNVNLKEGDTINFVVKNNVFVNSGIKINKNEKVYGIITSLEDNDVDIKPATIFAENFYTKDINGKKIPLKGIVYKKGNEHRLFIDWMGFSWVRGGEVHIKPETDTFILYLEE